MSTVPATTAVATRPDIKQMTIRQILQQKEIGEQIQRALPGHMKADRMLRVATTALARVPKLSQCTQESFLRCMLDCSAMGLEPDGRRAHLIPFDVKKKVGNDWIVERTDCTLIIDYKGYVELVRRSALVSSIHADVVCDNDTFVHDLGVVKSHTFDLRKIRGAWYAAYAMVHLRDGGNQAVIMSRSEIEAIRDKSQGWLSFKRGHAKTSVWNDHPHEMAKKTAFRRLCKWLTLSPEIADAIDREDQQEQIIETTATRIEASGNDRLAAMLATSTPDTPPAPQTHPEPEVDGFDASRGEEPQIEQQPTQHVVSKSLENARQMIRDAKTPAAVDTIIGGEAESGEHSAAEIKALEEFGDTRKRQIAIESVGAKTK